MNLTRWIWLATGAAGLACAPTLPAAYVEHSDAARRATSGGRHDEAAQHWAAAAETADGKRHADEARYRQASSLQRAGKADEARSVLRHLAEASGGRAARAAFDLAYIELEQGDATKGLTALRRAILEHPDSGLAEGGVTRLLRETVQRQGHPAEKRAIDDLWHQLRQREVGQLLGYRRAQWTDEHDSTRAALPLYLELARAHPYPLGVYWDEATLRAADIHAELGNPRAALDLLAAMLSQRESSQLIGSYERRYSRARYRMAEITRDQLGDCSAARQHFLRVASDFETSLLRDDALWHAARCAENVGDREQACADLRRLIDAFPDSRYVACAHAVCPTLTQRGLCHEYLLAP
jgi:predicted Zn-dependent protease